MGPIRASKGGLLSDLVRTSRHVMEYAYVVYHVSYLYGLLNELVFFPINYYLLLLYITQKTVKGCETKFV